MISLKDLSTTASTPTLHIAIRTRLIAANEYGDSAPRNYRVVQVPRTEASNSSADRPRDRREELTMSELRARLHQRRPVVPDTPPADVIRELRDEP